MTLKSRVSAKAYKAKFQMLLQCEEHQMEYDIRNYDMEVGRLF